MDLEKCICGGLLTFEYGDYYLEIAEGDVELITGVPQLNCVECGNQFVRNDHVVICKTIVGRARAKVIE